MVVVDSLSVWESTSLIFTGFTIFMIMVFTGLSFLGISFFPYGGMNYFWIIDFIPTLIIDTATLLRYAQRIMKK